jgi:hypothetical protein
MSLLNSPGMEPLVKKEESSPTFGSTCTPLEEEEERQSFASSNGGLEVLRDGLLAGTGTWTLESSLESRGSSAVARVSDSGEVALEAGDSY